jgi:cell division protein FtsB
MPSEPELTPADEGPEAPGSAVADPGSGSGLGPPDLSALPIAGITRRHVGVALGAFLAVWIIIVFARQVGDAAAATTRADVAAQENEAVRLEVAGLRRELELIQRQEYIVQQARGHGLGKAREIPFTLAPDAPPLAPDAPGSAAERLGSDARTAPLERWLDLLFGDG